MKLNLGHSDIFECPEGKFKAVLERVGEPKKRVNKPYASQVRFTFRVKTQAGKEHLVARTFCADLSFGSELYNFMDSWLDGEFGPFLDDNCRDLDLDLVLGKEAGLIVEHYDDGTHAKARRLRRHEACATRRKPA
jgi:hypothetical protein